MMTEDQIKHMASRFLQWRLPHDFDPDNGITFARLGNPGTVHQFAREPVGTNLLTADQAEAMVRHMIEGMPEQASEPATDYAWLIEAPGPNYLATRKLGSSHRFYWTSDASAATRFFSREQADAVMMGIREMSPALFAFVLTLGDARPVEHGWLAAEAA